MKCKVEGCETEARYRVMCLCSKHYLRQWRYGGTDPKGDPLAKSWEDAWKSVRADRELDERVKTAMRAAGGAM